ncbi:putative two-component system sensor protein [Winogradskyella psychrotolerans RS-3]|uniref:Putative two-component system sensor protein n=1 Tax=Winogradskyella psychrotolerans RS-3 TaxID=641526 RepID=S7VTF2_9FLAO|nr:histidine kinase [Winogradskyella psychrotolerans]EPR73525.1 putative two-component system sensor protein [Winogradskyella psychrotolerans RS-3]
MLTKNISYKEFIVHILVWLCISIFPLLTAYLNLGKIPYEVFLKQLMNPILFYVNYLVLVPYILLKRQLFFYIVVSILFLALYNYVSEVLIPNPIRDEFRNMGMRPNRPGGPFGIRHAIPVVFSLTIFLLGGIFSLVVDFYKRDRLSKELENEQKEIKLQFLRNQLNPHFLFNSLNSIYALVRSKSDDAPEAVITLSELMRYMLYEAGNEQVTLEKEINYIKNYIALQRLRLKNTEAVKLNIKGETRNLKIYSLLLISFIENAFKYGTDYKGNTHIDIKIVVDNNKLSLNVENIIGLYKRDDKNSGVGLENIKNQLNYLYKNNHELTINEDSSYYRVHLTLNLTDNEMHNN